MTYTGEVTPGGPSDVRTLPDVVIRKVSVGEMDNNCYLLTCRTTGAQLLVDAATDAERLLELVEEGVRDGFPEGIERGETGLTMLVTTHRHFDHTRALAEVLAATGARSAAGREDADHLPVKADIRLRGGDTLEVGDLRLSVIHLRGHTPGSVALVLHGADGSAHAFTGDSLFPGGPGKTTSPADFTSLMGDLEERIFLPLPDSTWVYPGHGSDTTIGAERPHLGEWRRRGW